MAVSQSNISEIITINGLPYLSGGNYAGGQPAQAERRYELFLGQDSGEIELQEITLAPLENLSQAGIGFKLMVFCNGQKLIYDIGYTIDFDNNKILYDVKDYIGDFEFYFFP